MARRLHLIGVCPHDNRYGGEIRPCRRFAFILCSYLAMCRSPSANSLRRPFIQVREYTMTEPACGFGCVPCDFNCAALTRFAENRHQALQKILDRHRRSPALVTDAQIALLRQRWATAWQARERVRPRPCPAKSPAAAEVQRQASVR